MTLEYFTNTVVPMMASLVYFIAGVGNLMTKNYALAGMWMCYGIANLCLLFYTVSKN